MDRSAIEGIMWDVRTWAEKTQEHAGYWHDDMQGLCAICSYVLFKRLRKHGYKPVLVVAWCHAYVELENYILDVTATQFSKHWKKVVITPKTDRRVQDAYYYMDVISKTTNLNQARTFFAGWSYQQNPYTPEIRGLFPCDVAPKKRKALHHSDHRPSY